MKKITTERIATDTANKFIEINVCYDRGDDYRTERGFYMTVYPVTIEGNWVSFEAYSGYRIFLSGCKRHSKVAESAAIELAESSKDKYICAVCAKHNLTIQK